MEPFPILDLPIEILTVITIYNIRDVGGFITAYRKRMNMILVCKFFSRLSQNERLWLEVGAMGVTQWTFPLQGQSIIMTPFMEEKPYTIFTYSRWIDEEKRFEIVPKAVTKLRLKDKWDQDVIQDLIPLLKLRFINYVNNEVERRKKKAYITEHVPSAKKDETLRKMFPM